MCLTCGCPRTSWDDDHHDRRNITTTDLTGAALAMGIPVDVAVSNLQKALPMLMSAMIPEAEKDLIVCKGIGIEEESRFSLGVAYWASKADVGRARDGFRDFSTARDVEQAAWKYLQNGGSVGLQHESGTAGMGRAVESYIWRGPDWETTDVNGTAQAIGAGDWLLGVVWEPDVWPAVKSSLIRGYSWQGGCKRIIPSAESLASLRRS